jgi:uncharacterized protein YjaZ
MKREDKKKLLIIGGLIIGSYVGYNVVNNQLEKQKEDLESKDKDKDKKIIDKTTKKLNKLFKNKEPLKNPFKKFKNM